MRWQDIPLKPTPRVLRQFAVAWLFFLSAAGAYQYLAKGRPLLAAWLAGVAVAVGVPGFIRPALLRWLFVGCMVLAFPIGWTLSLLMLMVMYYLVLTPVALWFRLTGRDALGRRWDTGQTSYWTAKETPPDAGSYFRQY